MRSEDQSIVPENDRKDDGRAHTQSRTEIWERLMMTATREGRVYAQSDRVATWMRRKKDASVALALL